MYLAYILRINRNETVSFNILCSLNPSKDKLPQYKKEELYLQEKKINIIVHDWKLVFCEIKEFKNSYDKISKIIISVSDIKFFDEKYKIDIRIFNPVFHPENIQHLFFLYNPPVMKHLIENDLYDSEIYGVRHFTDKIKKINSLIQIFKKIDDFDFNKAVESYKVDYYVRVSRRKPGKDDKEDLYIESSQEYWKNDNYIDDWLKPINIHRSICCETNKDDEAILPEDLKLKLTIECEKIQEDNIAAFKRIYSKGHHKLMLEKYIRQFKEEFIKSYYVNYFCKFKYEFLSIPIEYDHFF
jgi:hypothetical protein